MKRFMLIIIGLLFFQTAAQAAVPVIEREALVALYNSTNGPEWKNKTLWLIGDPCTNNWFGVICDQDANITQINLGSNNLVGTIPVELGKLASLQRLILWNNNLSGTIPVELGNLTDLRELDLNACKLSGTIPSEIGKLVNLQILRLDQNKLTGSIPRELGKLSKLLRLRLYYNQLSGAIPAELGDLTRLQELGLFKNQLSGAIPPELGKLTKLQSLNLNYNQLSGSIPLELGNMTKLRSLLLESNQLSGVVPPELGNLAELSGLYLTGNKLSGLIPSELGSLANLQYLDFSKNELSGPIPSELGNLVNLRELDLTANNLSESIPAALGSLANLINLQLNNNQLGGAIPGTLGNLQNLQEMDLSNNQLDGSVPTTLGNLPITAVLNLEHNQLNGPIPKEINKLVWLRLGSNRLTGSIPREFANPYEWEWENQRYDLHWNALFTVDAELDAILDAKSESDWSSTQTIAPGNFRVSRVGPGSVTFAWSPIEYTGDEGGYRVWYGTSPGGPYMDGGITANKSNTSHTISGLNPEQGYYFVVTTETYGHVNNVNLVISEHSNELFVPNSLARPTGIKATDGTYIDVVKVSFNTLEGATVYRVFRCPDRGQTCGLPIGYPKTGSFDDRKAVPGVIYYYRVRSCTTSACGKFSVADAGFANIPPDKPTAIRATDGIFPDRVRISWAGVEGATVYRVFRCLDTGPICGSPIGFPNGTVFDDRKGDPGTVYYYRIKACTAQHCSRFSVLNAGHRSDTSSIEDSEINAFLLPDQQVPIPTLSEWGRWLLIMMMFGLGCHLPGVKQRHNTQKSDSFNTTG